MGGIDRTGEKGEKTRKARNREGRHFDRGQGQVWRSGRKSSTESYLNSADFLARLTRPRPRGAGPTARSWAAAASASAARAVPRHADGSPSADRKSTRLNSSHTVISYAVFC